MLVLSRFVNEDIVINGEITIKVISISGDKVRIGIEAPKHMRVDRREIHEQRSVGSRNVDTDDSDQ